MVDLPGDGYTVGAVDFATLLIRKYFPERTDLESNVIRAYLERHMTAFDRITFSKRVGQGQPPDPTHDPGVQANTVFSSKKRIDLLAWAGSQPTIVEAKRRVTPAALGQLQTYRHLFLEEFPDALDPLLVVIGETSDDDTLRVLLANGVTAYLYPEANASGSPGAGGG
jgi:hypothetical protein